MNNCTATLTLLTRTDEVVARELQPAHRGVVRREAVWPEADVIPDGATVTRDGDRLLRADVTVVTCGELVGHRGVHYSKSPKAMWSDDTEGATPHVDPRERVRSMTVDMLEEAATPHVGMSETHVGMSETNRHDADVERCTICGGSGASKDGDCPRCEGTGREPDPCPDCEGLTRWLHDANGVVITTVAGVPCPSCGGRGKQTGRWHHEHKPCPDCEGTGCDVPGCGQVSVHMHHDCPSCGGSGRVDTPVGSTDCPDCDGKGDTGLGHAPPPCPSCGGEGFVTTPGLTGPCEACDESGTAPNSAVCYCDGPDDRVCYYPHPDTAPTVTDDMIDAACVAWSRSFDDPKMTLASQLRDIITAALAARPVVNEDPERGCLTMDGRHCWARNHEGCSECCWCPTLAPTMKPTDRPLYELTKKHLTGTAPTGGRVMQDPTNPTVADQREAQEAIDALPLAALYSLTQTADAEQEDVDHVFANKHSDWTWLRLPNGDLVLGVYPQQDTYFDVVDRAGV